MNTTSTRRGVPVTLEPSRVRYAEQVAHGLNSTYSTKPDLGRRLPPGTRALAPEAEAAVEQLLDVPAGSLTAHGADSYFSPIKVAEKAFIDDRHRGRVYFVRLDDAKAHRYRVMGSITVERARTRPIDESCNPPAYVWHVDDLDDPPATKSPTSTSTTDAPLEQEQIRLDLDTLKSSSGHYDPEVA